MRRPARSKQGRSQHSSVQTLPAPVGGWNASDSISQMPARDAVKLLNFYPTPTDVRLRGGNAAYATGITGVVKTLAVYNALSGTNKLFAVDDNDVWDVSSSGAASAQSATVTNGKFQWINFGDGTNNYLMMFNGVDSPLYYNGSTWTSITGASSPAITGVTTSSLIHVNEHKSRIYLIEKNTLSFWYLSAGAAGGAATEFDLSSYCKKGGYLMWMASWSFDSGSGPDDMAVFMTSEGEAIIYQGNDPGTAANWSLIGVYGLAKPLGRRSYIKYGGDLLIITAEGVYPISEALQSANNRTATTKKIEREFLSVASSYGSTFGWQLTDYRAESALICNIPVAEDGEHRQFVMNTLNGSWCEFDSWDAECFAVFNDDLYFGLSTKVQKAWSGTDDDGADIVALGKCAFTAFGSNTQLKRFMLYRPTLQVDGNITYLTGFDIDFSDNPIVGTSTYSVVSGAVWDTDNWDEVYWASGLEVVNQWNSPVPNVGYYVSGGLKVNTSDLEVRWVSNDYVFEIGGVI